MMNAFVRVCGNGDGQLVLRLHNQPNLFAGESPGWNFEERTIVALICNRTISPSRSHPLHQELNMCRKIRRRILNVIITITTITIIIITRPKPAYGRQGLAGSWGQDTDEVSTFLVFLMSHFAPAALSSDLTNLGPLMTMKIHLETLKTIETNQKP